MPTRGEELMLWVSQAEGGKGGIAICGGPPTLSYRGSEYMGLCTMTFFTVAWSSAVKCIKHRAKLIMSLSLFTGIAAMIIFLHDCAFFCIRTFWWWRLQSHNMTTLLTNRNAISMTTNATASPITAEY